MYSVFDLEELHMDECEFIFASRHQNAGHIHYINTANKLAEKLAIFGN
jgi:hypothetical protein